MRLLFVTKFASSAISICVLCICLRQYFSGLQPLFDAGWNLCPSQSSVDPNDTPHHVGDWAALQDCWDPCWESRHQKQCLPVSGSTESRILRPGRLPATICCPTGCGDPRALNYDPSSLADYDTGRCVCAQHYSYLAGGFLFGAYKPSRASSRENGTWVCANRGRWTKLKKSEAWSLDPEFWAQRRRSMLRWCGDLCRTDTYFAPGKSSLEDTSPATKGKYFPMVKSHFSCKELFSHVSEYDVPEDDDRWPPPFTLPAPYWDDFTYGDRAKVVSSYFSSNRITPAAFKLSPHKQVPMMWSTSLVNNMIAMVKNGTEPGTYGVRDTHAMYLTLQKKLRNTVRGKHCLVIGSSKPWLEAILLALGAAHVTTVDYGEIKVEHPSVSTITHGQIAEGYRGERGSKNYTFDAAFSYSSLEHAGLGRYGDIINPFADRIATAKTWCVVKPGGVFVVGVPSAGPIGTNVNNWVDMLQYSDQRLYGRTFWANMMVNWVQEDRGGADGPDQEPFFFTREKR